MPAAVAQGFIWGVMALGVYITFRLLDVADLSVDGSFATGGAVTVNVDLLAGYARLGSAAGGNCGGRAVHGLCTAPLHTRLGSPVILAGILTQLRSIPSTYVS